MALVGGVFSLPWSWGFAEGNGSSGCFRVSGEVVGFSMGSGVGVWVGVKSGVSIGGDFRPLTSYPAVL